MWYIYQSIKILENLLSNKNLISFFFNNLIFDEKYFQECQFYSSEILSLMMTHSLTRKQFSELGYNSEILYHIKSLTDNKKFLMEEKEIIFNCIDILNYSIIEEDLCKNFMNEKYFDILIELIKMKKFFSIKILQIIHSLSCLKLKENEKNPNDYLVEINFLRLLFPLIKNNIFEIKSKSEMQKTENLLLEILSNMILYTLEKNKTRILKKLSKSEAVIKKFVTRFENINEKSKFYILY